MTIPDYQTLMLPVLRLAAEGETRVADVSERIADDLGLTQAERDELLPSGRQRVLHNRIHWAKFYMSKAGLSPRPRAVVLLRPTRARRCSRRPATDRRDSSDAGA